MTPQRARSAYITVLVCAAAAAVLVIAVTAATGGGDTIAVTLPPVEKLIYAAIAFLFEEMIRRGFKKVDKLGAKCDRTHEAVEKVDVALRGYDGNGGALNDIRQLQEEMREMRERPVAAPPGFSVSPAPARRGS